MLYEFFPHSMTNLNTIDFHMGWWAITNDSLWQVKLANPTE